MRRIEKVRTGLLAASLLAAAAFAGPVITWVPPFSVGACKTMVKKDFGGGVGMKDGLTYLALQWWVTDGGNIKQWGNVAGANFDNDVKYFRDWGKANGVKVTLCVVNHVGGWNWGEGQGGDGGLLYGAVQRSELEMVTGADENRGGGDEHGL